MGEYIIAFLVIALGTLIIIKTEWIVENFGASSWAEEHLGTSGGTRLLYKLVGLAMIFLTLMEVTGLLGKVMIGTFGKLFGLK